MSRTVLREAGGEIPPTYSPLHLRQVTQRQVPDPQEEPTRPRAGQAHGNQEGTPAADAWGLPRTSGMAQAGCYRLLPVPRGADQQSGTQGIPLSRHRTLATRASAARPEAPHDVAADREARRPMAPQTAHPPPLAKPTLRRQTPKVGAVCGKAARTVLCGGRSVMCVPTAIRNPFGGRRARAIGSRRCRPTPIACAVRSLRGGTGATPKSP